MSPTANTKDAVRALVGQKIAGVLFDALPLNRADLRAGTTTFVFEDGKGFTFNGKGAYWWESADEISRAVAVIERELRDTERGLRGVLEVAGVLSRSGDSDAQ